MDDITREYLIGQKEEYGKACSIAIVSRLVLDIITIIRNMSHDRRQLGCELKRHIEKKLTLKFEYSYLFNSELLAGQLTTIFINVKEKFIGQFATGNREIDLNAWGLLNPSNKGIKDIQTALVVGRHAAAHSRVSFSRKNNGVEYRLVADEGMVYFSIKELKHFVDNIYNHISRNIKQYDLYTTTIVYSYLTINLMFQLAQIADNIDKVGDGVNNMINTFKNTPPIDYSYLN